MQDRLIWSADVPDDKTLMSYLGRMPELRIIKIDLRYLLGSDLGVIDRLNALGYQVFVDAKICEIPSKVVGLASKYLAHRPFILTCMAGIQSSGRLSAPNVDEVDGLKRFANACHAVGTKPCGVTVLTSKSDEVVRREFGRDAKDQVLYYVTAMHEAGFTDVVCSIDELVVIRAEHRFDSLSLNVLGIRPKGYPKDDQARTGTPAAALMAGATRLVIGRPITVGDLSANYDAIVAEMRAADSN